MQSWIHVLEWRAIGRRDQPALRDADNAYTYGELLAEVERRAGGWATLGIGPGDVVAVIARNSAAYLIQALALMRAGAIPALINWRLTAHELAPLLDLIDPVAVLAGPDLVSTLDSVQPPRDLRAKVVLGGQGDDGWQPEAVAPAPPRPVERLTSDSVFALMHTSGTTGRPKLIPLDHGSLIRSLSGFALDIGDQVAGAQHLQIMPLFHLAGFAQAMQAILTAGTLTVHETFRAADVVDAFETERIEFFTAGPTLIDMLVTEIRSRARPPDLSALVEIQYGSAPITPTLLRAAVETLGCRFRQIYGGTECQSFVTQLSPDDHTPDSPYLTSAGQLTIGWEARVVAPDGSDVPTGEPGELIIRGESLFAGYWGDQDATDAAFTDSWYHTGDIARLTEDRYLFIVDRAKDMVISGGENIYPAEVEFALAEHPAVAEVAVIGIPDEKWGQRVHAVVVSNGEEPVTEAKVIEWCRGRLAHFKCPRSVEFADDLPRGATGKVLKAELRAGHR
ncbi:class I adenylate-forming enzyme family protein [Nocardia vermiculata]|uniref:AMP-binding protein n=1 Tax=Nocardia vermiculata TaxID=257274 RepID=A0A846Y0P9_9NOCA|nr:AMP-binding protein [Nocardia vermiculata]NKY51580.1 AMP-binding protein [Nocardia vermiculata]